MLKRRWILAFASITVLASLGSVRSASAPKTPQGDPVKVQIAVTPKAVPSGGEAEVSVLVSPNKGFKLNRYPKIKVEVPDQEGLAQGAEGAVGNDAPPPEDQLETNYFKTVDPVRVKIRLKPSVPSGRREFQAKLSYFYCVAASGFCAPAKVPIRIPIVVR
jgi:hypothetical protein